MVPISKKDDLSFPCNQREIIFLPNASKVISLMIPNRTQPKVDPQLRPNQNGLIPETSTTVNILALRKFIEGAKERNQRQHYFSLILRKLSTVYIEDERCRRS